MPRSDDTLAGQREMLETNREGAGSGAPKESPRAAAIAATGGLICELFGSVFGHFVHVFFRLHPRAVTTWSRPSLLARPKVAASTSTTSPSIPPHVAFTSRM